MKYIKSYNESKKIIISAEEIIDCFSEIVDLNYYFSSSGEGMSHTKIIVFERLNSGNRLKNYSGSFENDNIFIGSSGDAKILSKIINLRGSQLDYPVLSEIEEKDLVALQDSLIRMKGLYLNDSSLIEFDINYNKVTNKIVIYIKS